MEEEVKQNPGLTGSIPPVVAPFGASTAPAESGAGAGGAAPAAPKPAATIRLKPVIRRPMIRKPGTPAPVAPAAPSPAADPVQAAKKATGTLKSITGPIPAQAVLKKTGIIAESGVAEGILTPVQAQAAKSKTSRISLESAIGVAPVAPSPAPMKTIRLRRPTDLKPAAPKISPPASESAETVAPLSPVEGTPVAAAMEPVEPLATTPAPSPESTVTQKKTLKLHRPGVSLKKPSFSTGAGPSTSDAAPASGGEVADIPDIADISPLGVADLGGESEKNKSSGGGIAAAITSVAAVAALAVLGFCTFKLYSETNGPGGIANGIISANEY